MLVTLNRPRPEPSLENVAARFVTLVEAASVATVQAMHPPRELLLRCFDDEVVVIRHQAEGMQDPAKALCDAQERRTKLGVISVASKDGGALRAASSHVKDAIRKHRARKACHGSKLAPKPPRA
jgi:hypothetical protein